MAKERLKSWFTVPAVIRVRIFDVVTLFKLTVEVDPALTVVPKAISSVATSMVFAKGAVTFSKKISSVWPKFTVAAAGAVRRVTSL